MCLMCLFIPLGCDLVSKSLQRAKMNVSLNEQDGNDNESIAMELTCDNSNTLNNNVDFSKLEFSETESSSQCTKSHRNLSITLNEVERNLLEQGMPEMELEATEIPFENSAIQESLVATDDGYFQHSPIELGRRLWPSTSEAQNYIKGCLWSPDGTCLLLPVHLDGMHVVELPADLYSMNSTKLTESNGDIPVHTLPSAVHVKEGGTVYDFAWYPFMNSNKPETCCWAATRQHEPIHMWDAFTGELRCSYRGYDDVDEVEAAISLTFTNDGERVIAGYKKSIKIFDTNVPGRDFSAIKVKQAMSCFALTADSDDTVTAGSWNGYINHYDLRAAHLGPLFTLGGHCGGITWLRYAASSDNNWQLFSGARKDNSILHWDMRNYKQPVRKFERTVTTNQRIYFDLSPQQRWLASGNTTGVLQVWDLLDDDESFQLSLHGDCLNGVNFHPVLPILATTSGQYHFVEALCETEEGTNRQIDAEEPLEKTVDYENALLLLWLGAHSLG